MSDQSGLQTDVVPEVFRQRWTICGECECVLIVQRDDHRGVPDEQEWEVYPDCPVCGDPLGSLYDADEQTDRTTEWRRGSERAKVAAEAARAEALTVASTLLQRIVDYWDGRPIRGHGEHIYADLVDVLRAVQADAAHNASEEADRG